jgi:hypothetical protein
VRGRAQVPWNGAKAFADRRLCVTLSGSTSSGARRRSDRCVHAPTDLQCAVAGCREHTGVQGPLSGLVPKCAAVTARGKACTPEPHRGARL